MEKDETCRNEMEIFNGRIARLSGDITEVNQNSIYEDLLEKDFLRWKIFQLRTDDIITFRLMDVYKRGCSYCFTVCEESAVHAPEDQACIFFLIFEGDSYRDKKIP